MSHSLLAGLCVAIVCCSGSIQAQSLPTQSPPTQSVPSKNAEGHTVIPKSFLLEKFMTPAAMAAAMCKGSQMGVCFNVPEETCLRDLEVHLASCMEAFKREHSFEGENITCTSRADCGDKGGAFGDQIGSAIGSCAGARYGAQHCSSLNVKSCSDFFIKAGLPVPPLTPCIKP